MGCDEGTAETDSLPEQPEVEEERELCKAVFAGLNPSLNRLV